MKKLASGFSSPVFPPFADYRSNEILFSFFFSPKQLLKPTWPPLAKENPTFFSSLLGCMEIALLSFSFFPFFLCLLKGRIPSLWSKKVALSPD